MGNQTTVFKRDGFKCLKCGSAENLTIDHVVPRCIGGRDILRNKQTLCKACNQEKGATVALYAPWRKVKAYVRDFVMPNADVTGLAPKKDDK